MDERDEDRADADEDLGVAATAASIRASSSCVRFLDARSCSNARMYDWDGCVMDGSDCQCLSSSKLMSGCCCLVVRESEVELPLGVQ